MTSQQRHHPLNDNHSTTTFTHSDTNALVFASRKASAEQRIFAAAAGTFHFSPDQPKPETDHRRQLLCSPDYSTRTTNAPPCLMLLDNFGYLLRSTFAPTPPVNQPPRQPHHHHRWALLYKVSLLSHPFQPR